MSDDLSIQLRILELFAASNRPLLIYPADVAELLGCSRPTAYRELNLLADSGWLRRSEPSRVAAFGLGPKAAAIGGQTVNSLLYDVHLVMQSIAAMGDTLKSFGAPVRDLPTNPNSAPVRDLSVIHPIHQEWSAA